ncbi:Ref family recombination enhancement nuclease [Vibrio phage vB_VpP_1]|nr:Ref family recombination enhancement nuclease [Vibrio phage vB_VpP_1]
MTKAEKEHMEKVAALGCIACQKIGFYGTPAEVHHIRKGQGRMRASNFKVIPLCPWHHRIGGYGEAFHAGAKIWQEKFGDELDLLEEINSMI